MTIRSNFLWSVRRELWEHRAVFVGPAALGVVALVAWMTAGIRHVMDPGKLAALAPARREIVVMMPYSFAASVILLLGFIIGAWYCTEALNHERRDRSILFWKSMPVSDMTTVLAKAAIPFVLIPAASFTAALATQLLMLLVSAFMLPAPWQDVPLGRMTIVMAYGIAAHSLWFAPIYGWLMLVSAWAKRAVVLWAALPFVALAVAERISLGTTFVLSVLRYRVIGAMDEAFSGSRNAITQLSQLEPAKYLSSPNLWLGLAFAAACLAVAIRLRRYRDPT